jgi:RHS repeat-associated protein
MTETSSFSSGASPGGAGNGAAAVGQAGGDGNAPGFAAPPAVALPKGGGAIRGIGEKFAANPVLGTASLTVPVTVSPGRSGFTPQLTLSYDSGAGNGPFGLGWNLSLPTVTRKTERGLPRYHDGFDDDPDVFLFTGADDLVPVLAPDGALWEARRDGYLVRRYRPRVEGLFARIERWTNLSDPADVFWRSISRDNVTTVFGKTAESRIADPADPARVFTWLICHSYDDKGNASVYDYAAENDHGVRPGRASERNRVRTANRYVKRIRYGNRTPNREPGGAAIDPATLPADTWMFEVVFDYGEGYLAGQSSQPGQHEFVTVTRPDPGPARWPARQDPFSSYRSGFEVRTYRLCRRVLMFHHFPAELGAGDYLVRSTEFGYDEGPVASFITRITHSGYTHQPTRTMPGRYLRASLPPLMLRYSQVPSPRELAARPVRPVNPESLANLPAGLDEAACQWIDLDGDGLGGLLTEQGDAWFYKRNLSPAPTGGAEPDGANTAQARLGPMERLAARPAVGLRSAGAQFADLTGDGLPSLMQVQGPVRGFFKRTAAGSWEPFRAFRSWPEVDLRDPGVKLVDLDGDGLADIMITDQEAVTWYRSLGEDGFAPAQRVPLPWDEEHGPRVVFSDATQLIALADFSGDGLADVVRVRNGEVCYWPNAGYGRFGAKVTMDNAPWFDPSEEFDQRHIRLADIDGSGTTDIIYLGRRGARVYYNQGGNAWSDGQALDSFPQLDDLASVQVLDLLGNGTACLVWSSPLLGDSGRQLRYLDLMAGKPHLLTGVTNNLGAQTTVRYAPSTRFYLQDQLDGRPWLTKLPFPVHVVERVEVYDHVSRNRFVTRYRYHHGYYDGVEREFRGFALVEQWDTEDIAAVGDHPAAANLDAASLVPPVYTKSWFHTGFYRAGAAISRGLAAEYYGAPPEQEAEAFAAFLAALLDDTILPGGLTPDEAREACRALKGTLLRQEVYGLDGTNGARHPYSVTEQNKTIDRLQPQGRNLHAVFLTQPREAISYSYERDPADPRVGHTLTLEVDAYGNELKSATVGYGRHRSPLPSPSDRSRQERTLVTYVERAMTNPIDGFAHPDDYRVPLPCEERTFELTGYAPAHGGRFRLSDFVKPDSADPAGRRRVLVSDGERADHDHQAAGRQRRLIARTRTLYRKDDLSGLAPPGTLEPLALLGETYKLAFTPGLLAHIFQRGGQPLLPAPAGVLSGQGADDGGYVAIDGGWWIPSGRVFYSPDADAAAQAELADARQHFFLPRRYRDPFGHAAVVTYDDGGPGNNLLVVKTEDAAGNIMTVQNDYRLLQPRQVTDPNGNRSAVAFDALGMVVGRAVMGKPTGPAEGDSLDGFTPDLTPGQIAGYLDAADPRPLAVAHLGSATTRIIYDLGRTPACAAAITRQTHVSDLPPGVPTKVQLSFTYSDGLGRKVQKKALAEPGPGPRRDADGAIVVGADGLPELTAGDVSPRWVGSGWTVYNNKGKPIRQFEPFFSDTHQMDTDTRIGVSPLLLYDPVNRVVATLHPDHTWEKVVFDAWQQVTYDVCDTVLGADGSTDPRRDADVGSYFERLPAADFLPTWYEQRITLAPGNPARIAAEQAAEHSQTPAIAHLDALGRPFLSIVINRFERDGAVAEELYATRVELDIAGRQRAVRDPVVQHGDQQGRLVMRYDYDLLGNRIHQASMEAGERWTLNDATGKAIRAWDSRRRDRKLTYDALRRPTELLVLRGDRERLAERTVYGEEQGAAANHRGRVYQVFDGAGVATIEAYDYLGNPLRDRRELLADYAHEVNWRSSPSPTTDGSFTSATSYDALGRPVAVTSPDGSVCDLTFSEAGLLDQIDVSLAGTSARTFVTGIEYDAKGRRTVIAYGNGSSTSYEYDPLSTRLTRQRTTRAAGLGGQSADLFADPVTVQDLRYTYDPVGNITWLEDTALKTVFFRNQRVEPVCGYRYDALYRLIRATGREHIGQTARVTEPPGGNRRDVDFAGLAYFTAHPNDLTTLRTFDERYRYDAVGNLQALRHLAADGGWTRDYEYDEASLLEPGKRSNRLTRTIVGDGSTSAGRYRYTDRRGNDVDGCLAGLDDIALSWDFKDQLRRADLGNGAVAHYIYDATGQRVRKVVARPDGTRAQERIYLGVFEVYRTYDDSGADVTLERETLHVMDDKQRVALVETRITGADTSPAQRTRFQLSNRLGSACLELDEDGSLISFEEYHPYGTTAFQGGRTAAEVSLKRYRFTGKERDEETGFTYHGARYCAPWLGRWMSPDPEFLGRATLESLNLYAYCAGNPVRYSDPDGKSPSTDGNTAHKDILPVLRDRINTLDYYEAEINVGNLLPGSTIKRKGRNPWGTGSIDLVIFATSGGQHVYDLKPLATSQYPRYDRQLTDYIYKLEGVLAATEGTVLERIAHEHPEVLAPIVVTKGDKVRTYILTLPRDPVTLEVRPGFIEYTSFDTKKPKKQEQEEAVPEVDPVEAQQPDWAEQILEHQRQMEAEDQMWEAQVLAARMEHQMTLEMLQQEVRKHPGPSIAHRHAVERLETYQETGHDPGEYVNYGGAPSAENLAFGGAAAVFGVASFLPLAEGIGEGLVATWRALSPLIPSFAR